MRSQLNEIGKKALLLSKDARKTSEISAGSIHLTVTSPPFLDVVNYAKDNWLRCWFNGFDSGKIEKDITTPKKTADWTNFIRDVFCELYRVTFEDGWVAFEVGEVRGGTIKLEEHVIPVAIESGFNCRAVLLNSQAFTKTANIWGVKNNAKGTNTNRIMLFQKNGKRFWR
jgi:hypothetical protein